MINLLPDDAKAEIYAARTNVKLVNYILILALGVIFLGAVSAGVYLVLITTEAGAKALIAENTSKSSSYSSVRAQADSLRSSLSSAKIILDKEVEYTKVVMGVAAAMPDGVVLDSLSLNASTFGTPITLQAYAKTTEDALALKDNFQRSPLFSGVTFISLAGSSGGQSTTYPITVSMSLSINKDAAQ